MYIRKLRGTADMLRFRTRIGRQDLPLAYFRTGLCYGFFVERNLIAGYCLVHAPLNEMQSIQQIPKTASKQFGDEDPFNYREFVGYFLNTKKHAFKFKLHLLKTLLFHKAAYVVYAYSTDQTEVEQFCLKGNPLRLYSGLPTGGKFPVNVEIMTKRGILKICSILVIKAFVKRVREWIRPSEKL